MYSSVVKYIKNINSSWSFNLFFPVQFLKLTAIKHPEQTTRGITSNYNALQIGPHSYLSSLSLCTAFYVSCLEFYPLDESCGDCVYQNRRQRHGNGSFPNGTELYGCTPYYPCTSLRGVCSYYDSHATESIWRSQQLRSHVPSMMSALEITIGRLIDP